MICNKCGQEMPEVGTFCPFCGAPKTTQEQECLCTEEAPAENVAKECKLKVWQLIAIIVGGVLALAILAGAVLFALDANLGIFGKDTPDKENAASLTEKDDRETKKDTEQGTQTGETVDAAEGETAPVQAGEGVVSDMPSYTALDEEVAAKANDVVATLGNRKLTVAELQLYYTNELYSFLNQYYGYLGYFGLDTTLPLDEQLNTMSGDGQTWQQYFLETALSTWQSYALLGNLMAQDGYVPSEQMQEQMDAMEETVLSMAQSYGYADAQAYLEDQMAPGVTMESYLAFNKAYYMGNEYLDQQYIKLQPTAEEIEAYYQENLQTFTDNGIEPDMGLNSAVRHILIQPEGGTEAEDGTVTYSDEEQAAAYAEAERILEEWKAGDATEASFAELANTYSKDGGSNTTGGLYENINIDASYVEEFRAWASDAARRVGDVAIVQTQFGYHIMYFVSGEDYFTYTVSQQLIAQRIQDMLTEAREAFPVNINYDAIVLYAPVFG